MKVILHIGMPKTGSTTLQRTFSANAELLEGLGICYPVGLSSSPCNHRILAYYVMSPRSYPRHMRAFMNESISLDLIEELSNKINSSIVKSASISTIVLSAEALYSQIRWYKKNQYFTFIDSLASDLCISAYLRSPAKAYLSLCQQKLKASRFLSPLSPVRYRKVIQSYQNTFPSAGLSIVPFERRSLSGHDIVVDFCERFLSETRLKHSFLKRSGDSNVSLSAESMAIAMLYRRAFFPDHDDVHTSGSKKLFNLLRRTDLIVNASRPSLRHEVQRKIEALAGNDLLWLRRRHGFIFEDIDYDELSRSSFLQLSRFQPKLLSEIVYLDRSKFQGVVDTLALTRFFSKSSERINWLKMVRRLDLSKV
jgi:hypothetical protein